MEGKWEMNKQCVVNDKVFFLKPAGPVACIGCAGHNVISLCGELDRCNKGSDDFIWVEPNPDPILIGPATAKALDASIGKWTRVVEKGERPLPGGRDCPLCRIFNPSINNSNLTCEQCPIGIDTGEKWCEGTPFEVYADAPIRSPEEAEAAKAELAYLIDLQSRCVVGLPKFLTLVVDLDERGEFKAHVEDEGGAEVFSYGNEEGYFDMIDDGFLSHAHDKEGLLSYMQHLGLVDADARFV